MLNVADIMALAPVIPVIVIDRDADAVPLARALVAGGLKALEVTLRTPAAINAIRAMSDVQGAVVGAGTVLNAADVDRAADAGAQFLVSPGLTPGVVQAAQARGIPLLPGTANSSDLMRGLEMGLTHFKFFPAQQAGGAAMLKAFAGPFPHLKFCPTGGVTPENAADYLSLPNVLCVGGSWMAPSSWVADGRWAEIEDAARRAAALRG
jgi:2-dehydro-3-deoxyphosphogluconate aldolase/(4S)-4-hydroxy-2-oxoglutarate aldolase